MTEFFTDAIAWAKEYGDVLGTIGFFFAIITIILTNGRLILVRIKGGSEVRNELERGRPQYTIVAPPKPAPEFGGKTAFAVLPPKELGDHDDHFAEGLAEDLVADLQKAHFASPELEAVAAMSKAGSNAQDITQELGVKYVIATSIRRQDDKFRITAQLIDYTGAIAWSERYNAAGDDLMAIQESTALKIVSQIQHFVDPSAAPEKVVYKSQTEAIAARISPKSRLTALILVLFPVTGILGVHRYYVGRPFTGFLYTITAGLFLIGWIIDFILILFGVLADGKGRGVRKWLAAPKQPKPAKA